MVRLGGSSAGSYPAKVLFDYTETELDLEPVWFTRFTLLSSKFNWNRIQAAVTIQAVITFWDTSHWRDKLNTGRTSKHHLGKLFLTSKDLTTNHIINSINSVVNIHFPPTDAILNPVNLLKAAVSRIRRSRFGLDQTVCKQTVQIQKPVSDSV